MGSFDLKGNNVKKLLFVLAIAFASLAGAADYVFPPLPITSYTAQQYAKTYVVNGQFADTVMFMVDIPGDTILNVTALNYRQGGGACSGRGCRPPPAWGFVATDLTSIQLLDINGVVISGVPPGSFTTAVLQPGWYVLSVTGLGHGTAISHPEYAGRGEYKVNIQGAAPAPVCTDNDGIVIPCGQPIPPDPVIDPVPTPVVPTCADVIAALVVVGYDQPTIDALIAYFLSTGACTP